MSMKIVHLTSEGAVDVSVATKIQQGREKKHAGCHDDMDDIY